MGCVLARLSALPIQGAICCVVWYVDACSGGAPPEHDEEQRFFVQRTVGVGKTTLLQPIDAEETQVKAPQPIGMEHDGPASGFASKENAPLLQ